MANIFPEWSNTVPRKVIVALIVLIILVSSGIAYYFTPEYTRVGYAPDQPVPFDHHLHVEQVGMDCRYCHTNVEISGRAGVPAASTCMNCHDTIKSDSPLLAPIRESYESGEPVEWVRIHQAPEHVYFNHAAHVNRGVSCVECHGEVNRMEVVRHEKSLSMAFCLECHNEPERYVRPLDKVYDLDWEAVSPTAQVEMGRKLVEEWSVNPPLNCSGCHR